LVIFGAGAVGGVVGGGLSAAGHDVLLIARGPHLAAIRESGLLVRSPAGDVRHRVPAVGDPAEVDWRPGDVVLLAVKSTDTAGALRALAVSAPPQTPVFCLQNAVANEPAALRLFPRVYGVCVMLPASHLAAGVVVAHCAPTPGILDLGRYPGGLDATAEAVSAALVAAGFVSQPRPDIMRWKYTKLLLNLGNAVEALCGRVDGVNEAVRPLREEAVAVLRASGIDHASAEEDAERRGDILRAGDVPGAPREGGSSWQSLRRRTGSVEADYLNGEIVLLGRLHGVPTPGNELARQLVNRAARAAAGPGTLTPREFLNRLRQQAETGSPEFLV
jgi:2-dehydropantoate 2-reductase